MEYANESKFRAAEKIRTKPWLKPSSITCRPPRNRPSHLVKLTFQETGLRNHRLSWSCAPMNRSKSTNYSSYKA